MNFVLSNLGFRLNTAGAGFNALAAENRVLQIRQEADNTRPHAMRSFDGARIGFSANGAGSGHRESVKLKVKS